MKLSEWPSVAAYHQRVKQRRKDQRNVSNTRSVVGEVEGKVCVVVDDMIDTAATMVDAATGDLYVADSVNGALVRFVKK